MSQYTLSYLGG